MEFRNGFGLNFLSFVLIILVSVVHISSAGECGEEMLTKCRYPLRVLTNNQEFSFATKKEDLDALCPDINEGLRCIDNYTRTCMDPRQRGHFYRLYSGTSLVIQEICEEGSYQDEFLKHAPCLRAVKSDHEHCGMTYQTKINEITSYANGTRRKDIDSENVVKSLCCSFRSYLKCSEDVVLDKCGEETAAFTSDFLYRMSSSLLEIHCDKYSPDSVMCGEEVQNDGSGSSTITSSLSVLLALYFASKYLV